jgi:hypothetical protein
MIIFHKFIGPGAASRQELTAQYGLNRTATPALLKSIGAGALYGGILAPSDEHENIVSGRLKNATVSALSMATLTAGSIGLKSTASAFLRNDMIAAGTSGIVAGAVSADGHSLLSGKGLASSDDRLRAMINFGAGGFFNGAANTVHEFIAPTSGIRGVRTLEDMTKLADSTVIPNAPKRYAFEANQNIPPKAELLQESNMGEWYNRTAKNLREEIDNSTMPEEWRKQIVSGHQDLTYGLEAIHNRPDPKPIITVYGSARFKETDFRYQRARYIGGRAAQEGYDVMTGGGPGTMEAANRGAYEAGGTSIGVVLKLPYEKRGNGYQTVTAKHRYFYTRLENLKKANAFVVEDGGIGTGAEGLDTLTHIQTGKMAGVPVFFIGKEKWYHLDGLLKQMEKDGTISPSDRNLYKILDDPNDIFTELAKHNRAREIERQKQEQNSAAPPEPRGPILKPAT